MNLLTFDNPVFRYYAIAAALMIVKMMSQGWITVFRMIKVKGGYRYTEDAQRSLANPHPSPARCGSRTTATPRAKNIIEKHAATAVKR